MTLFFLLNNSCLVPMEFVSLGIERQTVMIKLVAAYRPTIRPEHHIEVTGSKGILSEVQLDKTYNHRTKYQTIDGTVLPLKSITGKEVSFMDGTVTVIK